MEDLFIEVVKVGEVSFLVRGLTLAEFTDLNRIGLINKDGTDQFKLMVSCCERCIINWDYSESSNYIDWDPYLIHDHEYESVFTKEAIYRLGAVILSKLSLVSKEEEAKYRGYLRFQNYKSRHSSVARKFDCEFCLKNNESESKLCGLTESQKRNIYKDYKKPVQKTAKRTKAGRYKAPKKKKKKKLSAPKELKIGKTSFPECPVSWIEPYISILGSSLHYCHSINSGYFEGGVGNYRNKIFRIQQIVADEANQIEREYLEENK